MKKAISLLVILSIVFAMSATAFAAPTIEYVFGGAEEDGNYYYYMFGRNDVTSEEVGISIEGKAKLYNLDDSALIKAQASGKFGIGLADPENKLGDSFQVTPYQVISGVKEEGAEQAIVKEEVTDSDEIVVSKAVLSSLSVKNANGDELIAGFDAAETTYYVPVSALTDELTVEALAEENAQASTVKEDANNQYVITVTGEDKEANTYYVKYRVPVTANLTYHAAEIANGGNLTGYTDALQKTEVNANWFGSGVYPARLLGDWNTFIAYDIDCDNDIKLVSAKLGETAVRRKGSTTMDATKGETISVYQNTYDFDTIYDTANDTFKDMIEFDLVDDNDKVMLGSHTITEDWIGAKLINNPLMTSTSTSYKMFRIPEMEMDVSKMEVYEGNRIVLWAQSTQTSKDVTTQFLLYLPPELTVEYIVCD